MNVYIVVLVNNETFYLSINRKYLILDIILINYIESFYK